MGSYGVATNNLFALLDDENEDPQVMAAKLPAVIPDRKQEVAQPKQTDTVRSHGEGRGPAPGRGRTADGRGGRGGRGAYVGHGGGRHSDRPHDEVNGELAPSDVRNDIARGRGGRGFGGRGRGRYGDRPPRREFDRRDGTGRGYETEKRLGAGKGNWGTVEDEAAGNEQTRVAEGTSLGERHVDEPVNVVAEQAPASGAGAPLAEAEQLSPAKEAPPAKTKEQEEEEEKQMTLDEWEKLQEDKRKNLNKLSDAKVVADKAQFKGMQAYTRGKVVEEEVLEVSAKKPIGKKIEKGRKERYEPLPTVETGFRVGEEPGRGRRGEGRGRYSGGRSGRGISGRGYSGRSGPGPESGRAFSEPQQLKIDDDNVFPTLGKA